MPQSLLSVQQTFLPVSDLSAAPPCRVSAAGRGGSKYNPENPQPKNQSNHNFLQKKCEVQTKSTPYHTNHPHTHTPNTLKNSPHKPQNNQNPTYPQHYPQTQQKESKQTTPDAEKKTKELQKQRQRLQPGWAGRCATSASPREQGQPCKASRPAARSLSMPAASIWWRRRWL